MIRKLARWATFLAPCIMLTLEMASDAPLSRLSVFAISLSVTSIVILVFHNLYFSVLGKVIDAQSKFVSLQERHVDLTDQLADRFVRDHDSKSGSNTPA